MSQIPQFTHLHLHTEYSLLDGANKIKPLAKKLKKLGMTSVAMTDHGNMFGAIAFYNAMRDEGIKPIIGMEAYIHNSEDISDKTNRQRYHLCLYAKNEIGYKNLMYLSSQAYINGFYYYPRINKKILKENSEGLVCSAACLQGEINWHLNTQSERNVKFGAKGYEEAKKIALEYKEIFGDDFYLEIMRHGISDQLFVDDQILKLSKETGIKVVATNDTHYLEQKDADAHEAFMCIAMNKLYDDPNRLRHSVHEFYLKSPEQIAKLYSDIPEAIEATQEIAAKCNLTIKLGNPTPPNFKFTRQKSQEAGLTLPEPDNEYSLENDKILFIHECRIGLEDRLKIVPTEHHQEYRDRLEVEIEIINNMKFPGYMLIVWDFVIVAKRMGIPVGPGRGSAAGSLVAFSLKITDIDPIPYGLLFERFLNPERVSMPDIDMDFCQSRRGEIIDYVVQQYGRANVAQIITFGKLLAKGVIRDVARVLDMPYSKADAMAKLIPDELGIDLKNSWEKEPKIRELCEADPQAARVWEYALALEGLNRNAGTHAAGVVISNEPLWKKTPLFKPSGLDTLATQYNGKYIEDVDLIKFDFLGLKTLTVIEEANKLIEQRHGKRVNFITTDVNDKGVYDLIQTGNTIGLFQIESDGMQDLCKRLKPSNFEDIIAVLALYRPGPMESGMLDDFIERKHGRAKIDYFHDELESALKPILENTYGVIVYQEQVMQIVQSVGGFSLGGADLVRRAMGKKIKEEMDRLKGEFADGAQNKGYTRAYAEELFDLIVKFAGYGFNKSHSAAYALVTFYTSYLKCYYPAEFMAALLTLEKDNTDKVVKYVDETKRLGLELFPPDINKSDLVFSAKKIDGKEVVMFGMGAIKGAGDVAINAILNARESAPFKDLPDFISKIDGSKVNKRVIESLTKAGAFDSFGYTRKSLLSQIEKIVDTVGKAATAKKMMTGSLFGDSEELTKIDIELEHLPEFDPKELLEFEKATLGFYVSGHPLDEYKKDLEKINFTLSSQIDELEDGSQALFVGKIESITEKTSKKGNKFGIVSILDFHGTIEFMLFEDKLKELQDEYNHEEPIAFKVRISKNESFTRISVLKIETIFDAQKEKLKIKQKEVQEPPLNIAIAFSEDENIMYKLFDIIANNQGKRELKLIIKSKLADLELETGFKVTSNVENLIKQLEGVYLLDEAYTTDK
ncbi:DNA polymerase III subunit alpha [Aliarcobacter butzleri]|uniref:DNA polymerase III subunit alpha n=1 Tax=Aliarcobacter butzleri L351 TaxID=1447259 RepID=A0A837J7I7_9BACT|nr:DNA polymerase III subunit alpha [Aliarcobacter butzleri]KLE01993.1 DNA polymerase III subunit alpha [Aliarcobacter butzleri L351]KLE13776.1 DNA polymerase III subunit alpha [Aliarcobacter butzleri L350]MDN5047452.1 DNA polymerase III subunit alpha [Aliarcobacter butzleri]MDN5059423.1 DNA polymerase III subunit alpha [Aliarcobacter butzleri]MDN5109960.1 DNA polymerase III subunit alpha [Aliarcobacter butzleri]